MQYPLNLFVQASDTQVLSQDSWPILDNIAPKEVHIFVSLPHLTGFLDYVPELHNFKTQHAENIPENRVCICYLYAHSNDKS